MSAFVGNSTVQMSLALDRSHAVGSLYNGTLEVVQHRRGGPFLAGKGTVVLDDTDRIFTQTWLNVLTAASTFFFGRIPPVACFSAVRHPITRLPCMLV